ncbi:MAG: class I SAM-dependent methyltransferase [Dehalococcoidales bacterium]|nr:class I SAM-dependent methyltransferase [Dehalococcoidales bacterium]
MNIEEQLLAEKEPIRENLLKYTRQAFGMLPPLYKPRVLDIGCGSGAPTLELAGLTQGKVTGIDIDRAALDLLRKKIKKAGLSDKVDVQYCPAADIKFPDESFDLIWSEGCIHIVGFERGLREWKRLLKPGGYMVLHDESIGLKKKLEQIPRYGYEILGYFELDKDVWWDEYFGPMERFIDRIRSIHADDIQALDILKNEQTEIDNFGKYPERYCSVFFVLRRD